MSRSEPWTSTRSEDATHEPPSLSLPRKPRAGRRRRRRRRVLRPRSHAGPPALVRLDLLRRPRPAALHRDGDHRPERAARSRRHERRRPSGRHGQRPHRGPPPHVARRRPRHDDRRPRADPVRRPGPDRRAAARVGRCRPVPHSRVHRRRRRAARRQCHPTRAHGLVIGSAVLVTGLLLVLAALVAGGIPGGALPASSGIGRSRAFLLSPIHPATWYANAAIAVGPFVAFIAFGLLASIASVGFSLLFFGIGVLFLAAAIEGSRLVARLERRRAFAGEAGRPLPHPYKRVLGVGLVGAVRGEFADESRWRDVLYVAVNVPLTFIEFLVVGLLWGLALSLVTTPIWYDAVAGAQLPWFFSPLAGHDAIAVATRLLVGLALLPVAASLSQLVITLHRAVVSGLLCTSESRELRRQVESLRQSRSDVLDSEASELHRIERDLHDGAQQRLVMLNIDLGLAAERLDSDPAAARALILEGQAQAREALAEIRDLVRGIAPSILLDRGLVAALESIVGPGPVPTVIRSALAPGERMPVATERAAYFVATEALANVAKHSGASQCEVRIGREGGRLIVEVRDDGRGGATVAPGGGLDGLAKRIAGVDGTFSVSSPSGGPTTIRAEIPIEPVATTEP